MGASRRTPSETSQFLEQGTFPPPLAMWNGSALESRSATRVDEYADESGGAAGACQRCAIRRQRVVVISSFGDYGEYRGGPPELGKRNEYSWMPSATTRERHCCAEGWLVFRSRDSCARASCALLYILDHEQSKGLAYTTSGSCQRACLSNANVNGRSTAQARGRLLTRRPRHSKRLIGINLILLIGFFLFISDSFGNIYLAPP